MQNYIFDFYLFEAFIQLSVDKIKFFESDERKKKLKGIKNYHKWGGEPEKF